MTFSTLVPYGNKTISNNGTDFRANFTAMNTAFSADHTQFDSGINIGKHKQVSFLGNSPSINPIPITQEGITMISNISGSHFTLSYIERNSGVTYNTVQLTSKREPLSDDLGNSFLPGRSAIWDQSMGILVYWGKTFVAANSESPPINYASGGGRAFETAPYCIQITGIEPYANTGHPFYVSADHLPTHTSFRIINNGTQPHDVYWLAIGREEI
jgi:hypothetical protein